MRPATLTRNPRLTRPLLWSGVLGPPLFVVAFLIEGATRPGYDPARLPISLLSLGDLGWTQTANFIVDGALMIAFAVGLRRSLPSLAGAAELGSLLVGIFGAGLIGAGIFPADPGGGYPPGSSASLSGSTGTQHDLSTLVVFGALIAGCFAVSRHFAVRAQTGWATYSAATGTIVAVGFVLMVIGFSGTNDITLVAGLVMRLTVIAGWSWIAVLAIHELRAQRGRSFGSSLDSG
jgi:Protein of unknown function (DUF998)